MGTSVLLLCACPLYPATGALFAGLGFWLKGQGGRLASMLALFACLAVTGAHFRKQVQLADAKERIRKRMEERQLKAAVLETNITPGFPITNPSTLNSNTK